MSAAESGFLRAFREGFEQGNRAWNGGDVKTAHAALPERVEYRLAAIWPEARVLRSRDEVIEFFENFQETFPDARTASHEYVEGANGTLPSSRPRQEAPCSSGSPLAYPCATPTR
jgi:ketosteroid isomerase-like protein